MQTKRRKVSKPEEEDARENAIEWETGQKAVTVTLWAGRLQTKILQLAREHPKEFKVVSHPKDNSGYLVAHIPLKRLDIMEP